MTSTKTPHGPGSLEPQHQPGTLSDRSQVATRSMPLAELRGEIGDVEFDPDVVLASLAPYDAPSSEVATLPPPMVFEDEQPAHVHVHDLDFKDKLLAIASRLQKSIADDSNPSRKAEYSLVASEILALSGDITGAQALAGQAAAAQPASWLAHTQARHLALEAGDMDAAQQLAVDELQTIDDPESLVHMHLWHADFSRIVACDRTAASDALLAAAQVSPRDVQVTLLQLLENLQGSDPVDLEWVAADSILSDCFDAIQLLTRLRQNAAIVEPGQTHAALVLLKVSSALAEGDTTTAATQLARFTPLQGSQNALRWLRACLWAASNDTHQAALEELLQLQQDEPTAEVHRALLERSVELRDRELTRRLLLSNASPRDDLPEAADELVLALLANAPAEFVQDCCERLSVDETYAPLTLAAKNLLNTQAASWYELDAQTQATACWAEWITTAGKGEALDTSPDVDLDDASDDVAALSQVFALETARKNFDWNAVAHLIADLPDDTGPWQAGDRETVAALFFEAANDREDAERAWEDVLVARPLRECALRAILEQATPSEKCVALETTARSLDVRDERGVWLLLEAALADASDNYDQAEQLLQHAHVLDPGLILPMILGEDLARKHGQPSHVADWVTKRGELADEPAELSLSSVEEALLHWHDDKAAAEHCLRRALDDIDEDRTLRELWRHVSADAPARASDATEKAAAAGPDGVEDLCEAAAQAAWFGNWQAVGEIAGALAATELETVAKIWAEQVPSARVHATLFDRLFAEARGESDPIAQRELYERLARLDSNSPSQGNFELWQNAILERTPGHLPALRALELSFIRHQRWQELATVSDKLMQCLTGAEAMGYCWLSATLHIYTGNWANSEPLLRWAAQQADAPLWALRRWYAHVQASKDHETMHSLECRLVERASYAGDTTALLIRCAQSAQQLQRWAQAATQLRRALDTTPDSAVAWSMWAVQHLEQGELPSAAEGFEQLSQICADPSHRSAVLSHAIELWLALKDEARAEFDLEQLVNADPRNTDAVDKLTQCYRQSHAHDRLAALLERQIERLDSPAERLPLQLERARCLLALGLTIAAEKAIAPVLSAFPQDLQALEIKAEVAAALDDFSEAESMYLRLLDVAPEPTWQAELHRKLGMLYEKVPDRSQAAQASYRRLLELKPGDAAGLTALVRLAVSRNDASEAIQLQTQLLDLATEPSEQRERYVELARIYETAANDRRRAEEVLERARRKWQNDSVVLRAFAGFYQRAGDASALQVLLDRSVTEARRALHTGRFDLSLFEVLACVAHLRNEPQAAESADAVVAALTGQPMIVRGTGSAAFDPRHDEGLAPELLNLPLRAMLQQSGWALDSVSPVDLRAYAATPLSQADPQLYEYALQLAAGFAIDDVQLWVTDKAGCNCLPLQSRPPILLLGRSLVSQSNPKIREFLLIRALKCAQAHMTALARTANVDLGPLIAAYLSSFLPDWQPTGVDMKKVEDFRRQLAQQLPHGYDHGMSPLAQDVVVALGNRASQLGAAVYEWGSRTALLALGEPALALDAIAVASGGGPLPGDTGERIKWIARHAEARNVMVFAVSDAYLRLRTQLL